MSSHYCSYDIRASIYEMTSSMRATYTLNIWHHSHYLCHDTHCIDNITPTLFMTSHSPYVSLFALYKTSHPHFLTSNQHFEDITPTILDIVSTVSVSSHQLYRWYHSHYMYDITSSICETFCTLYLWHRTHSVWHHNPVCWLHHTRPMYDIICTTEDVTSTPSHQAIIFDTSHPLQAWHHIPSITSHQLYLCHYKLSTAITATLVWHHTHYMCDIICTIYNIISTAYVITLLYWWQQNLDIWNNIQYVVQNIQYPCDITVTSLCHHTRSIESITPTLCMASHSA